MIDPVSFAFGVLAGVLLTGGIYISLKQLKDDKKPDALPPPPTEPKT